jgi:tripartite-type tricarboxylate transporter receptor subunit TctC
MKRWLLAIGLCFPMLAGAFPERALTIVVGFPPGSGPDVAARMVATRLAAQLGQQVIVENRAGAGGTIGTAAVARAAPDGHTLVLGSASALTVSPGLYKNLPYDPVKSFTPIVQMLRGAFILSVRSDMPVKDLKGLVEYTRARAGKVNYGSSGNGTLHHLCVEMLKNATGASLTHIPYKGGPQNWVAFNGGEVDVICDSMPGPMATLKSGRARAIAVTGEQRLSILPEAGTFREQGVPEVDIVFWYGFLAPAGTPRPIVDRLNAEITTALKDPELLARYAAQNIDITPGTPAEFGELIARETAQYRQVITRAGITVD